MISLDEFALEKLVGLERRKQRRVPHSTRRLPWARVERSRADGSIVTLVDFSSNDTLGLSHHRTVVAAAKSALDDGVGAGGSRLVSGMHPLTEELEHKLAQKKHKGAAMVLGSGWHANVGVIPSLVSVGDAIVIDELANASLFAGARLSSAGIRVVVHNDVDAIDAALRDIRSEDLDCRVLVVTESVFAMDGDRAPVAKIAETCAGRAWLLVDDAHGFLVDDDDEAKDVARADVVTGTLSQALGAHGGVVAGSRPLIDLLLTRCRPVLFGTALPPAVLASANAALDVVAGDHAGSRRRPRALAAQFCAALDLPPPQSHIVPLLIGEESAALALMEGLIDDGFLVVAIRPPTVPAGTSRLRVAFSAAHSDDDVDSLARCVAQRWQRE
jgi:8-amino-7-oxononanoate synthase